MNYFANLTEAQRKEIVSINGHIIEDIQRELNSLSVGFAKYASEEFRALVFENGKVVWDANEVALRGLRKGHDLQHTLQVVTVGVMLTIKSQDWISDRNDRYYR